MSTVHPVVGGIVIGVCVLSALVAGLGYRRRRGAGAITAHLLALAQTALVAQVAIGLLLLADDRRAADRLHYLYGSLALGAALSPWFYAPRAGPRRLLWFAGATGVAAALAIRAFMTGS
jgi:hypothetical protein